MTSVTYDYAAFRVDEAAEADELMATAKQTLVLIDLEGRRPLPVPDSFRSRIAEFEA
jgi:acyl-CoA thioesterase FadM